MRDPERDRGEGDRRGERERLKGGEGARCMEVGVWDLVGDRPLDGDRVVILPMGKISAGRQSSVLRATLDEITACEKRLLRALAESCGFLFVAKDGMGSNSSRPERHKYSAALLVYMIHQKACLRWRMEIILQRNSQISRASSSIAS